MFGLIITIFVFFLIAKVLFHIGFGIAKICFSLLGLALMLLILPVTFALIVPFMIFGAIVAVAFGLIKAIF